MSDNMSEKEVIKENPSILDTTLVDLLRGREDLLTEVIENDLVEELKYTYKH